ncbi:MAG TPA: ferredoxin--NADP reductase [Thermoanaerobaculaceae bacterium]|nr:ferredoxin--NADP reductase [Thermoanaerobaculaceae bacterium]HRS16127.1 ferredoxin--NADP reductase [Thermoanaerobaculaceae bacterium]
MPELNAVVLERQELSPHTMLLRVAPVGWELPEFQPGQYAVLGLSAPPRPGAGAATDGLVQRAYSIASGSRQREHLEFFVTRIRSGELSPHLCELRPGDRLYVRPAFAGTFTLDRVPADRHAVLIATGTGLAPYMSMLRTHLEARSGRNLAVVHGARFCADLAYRAEIEEALRQHRHLSYFPIVSAPEPEVAWSGLVGRVQDVWRSHAIGNHWGFEPSPADTHVLLCGNPAMVDEMTALLEREGFRPDRPGSPGEIHAERYW